MSDCPEAILLVMSVPAESSATAWQSPPEGGPPREPAGHAGRTQATCGGRHPGGMDNATNR